MSIFENYPNLENIIINNSTDTNNEDEIFETFSKILYEFLERYKNIFSEDKIKQFCLDAKKLFRLNNLFWEGGLKEIENDDDNDELQIVKLKKMVSDTKILIQLFPEESFLSEKSDKEVLSYLAGIDNRIKILTESISSFYDEMNQNMKSLNETMSNLGNTLTKATLTLKAHYINSVLKEKLNLIEQSIKDTNIIDFLEHYKWFINNKNELSQLIKENPDCDSNILLTQDSLIKTIQLFQPFFNKLNSL